MTETYLQARSEHGYLIHAMNTKGQRSGLREQFIGGRPLCGKIIGRAHGFSTMRLLFPPTEFYTNPEPFTATMIHQLDKAVCIKCATRVMQASTH